MTALYGIACLSNDTLHQKSELHRNWTCKEHGKSPPPLHTLDKPGPDSVKVQESTGSQCLCNGVFPRASYYRIQIADITHTYPSKHDKTKRYPHPHNSNTTQLLEFCSTGTE